MKPYVWRNWVGVYRKLYASDIDVFIHIQALYNDVKTTDAFQTVAVFSSKLVDIYAAEYYVINIKVDSSQIDNTTPIIDPPAPVKPVASPTII